MVKVCFDNGNICLYWCNELIVMLIPSMLERTVLELSIKFLFNSSLIYLSFPLFTPPYFEFPFET